MMIIFRLRSVYYYLVLIGIIIIAPFSASFFEIYQLLIMTFSIKFLQEIHFLSKSGNGQNWLYWFIFWLLMVFTKGLNHVYFGENELVEVFALIFYYGLIAYVAGMMSQKYGEYLGRGFGYFFVERNLLSSVES